MLKELECVDKILGYFGKAQIETMTLSKCDILTIKQALITKSEKEQAFNELSKLVEWEFQYDKDENVYCIGIKIGDNFSIPVQVDEDVYFLLKKNLSC